jgi:cell division septation protein DedD
MAAGEAAQIPTSPTAGTQIPTSPAPPTYGSAQPAGPTPTSSTLGSAWRSADSGGATAFGVQLGAFASENAATSEWEQLTARFSAQLRGLVPHVVSAQTTTGQLFRLQALVADEATARALCDMLKKQSQACVPVLPH